MQIMDRIASLQRMLVANPGDSQLHYFLATDLFAARRFAEAADSVRAYLALQTDDQGAAYRILALSLIALGDVPGARAALHAGINQARKHGHPSMAQEFEDTLAEIEP